MLTYCTGNLFDSGCQGLVDPVNCVGTSGAGLALQFREHFPEEESIYRGYCRGKKLYPGRVLPVPEQKIHGTRWILFFPTKTHWKLPSRLSYIEAGLRSLTAIVPEFKLKSVAIPALGCGYGGLPWPEVKELIDRILTPVNCDFKIYGPHSKS